MCQVIHFCHPVLLFGGSVEETEFPRSETRQNRLTGRILFDSRQYFIRYFFLRQLVVWAMFQSCLGRGVHMHHDARTRKMTPPSCFLALSLSNPKSTKILRKIPDSRHSGTSHIQGSSASDRPGFFKLAERYAMR